MTVRRLILLLVVPLFLLLAGVNGALLYSWELREAERGLEKEAIAAAVTVAAFAEDPGVLVQSLETPARAAAFRAAAAQVKNLRALHIAAEDGRIRRIAGPAGVSPPASLSRPTKPVAHLEPDATTGRSVMVAAAPAGRGGFVVAEIDASPIEARKTVLRRALLGLFAGAGLLGVLLAGFVGARIVRELDRSGVALEAIRTNAPLEDVRDFRIRETRDLALAVRLMRASVSGRLTRGRHELERRDRQRTEATATLAYRDRAIPPTVATAAGAEVAARIMGEAPPGCFHVLCVDADRGALILGECADDSPAAAFASALAATRYFSARLLAADPAASVAHATAAFGIVRCVWTCWSTEAPPTEARTLALLEPEVAAKLSTYAQRAGDMPPHAVLDEAQTLLSPTGMVAIVRASRQGGER